MAASLALTKSVRHYAASAMPIKSSNVDLAARDDVVIELQKVVVINSDLTGISSNGCDIFRTCCNGWVYLALVPAFWLDWTSRPTHLVPALCNLCRAELTRSK